MVVVRATAHVPADRIHRQQTVRLLHGQHILNGTFEFIAIATAAGNMTPRQKRHHGQRTDPGLTADRRRERSIRLLIGSQEFQPPIDGSIDLPPLLRSKDVSIRPAAAR